MTGDSSEVIRLVKYGILQSTTVPSLICDLLVFSYFIRHWRKEVRNAPQNHVILCILIVSFIQKITDTPANLYYLRWGTVPIHDGTFCLTWNWLDYTLIGTCLHLLAWCSIERHLFIFEGTMMKKTRYLVLFHYTPLVISLTYLSVFYAIVMFFQTSCANVWHYAAALCGAPCYVYFSQLSTFDWSFHCAFPNILIFVVNICLFCRVIWQKIKRQRPVQWRRQRKLIVQLAIISILYLIFYAPMVVVGLVQTLWTREFLSEIQLNYFYFLPYFTTQLLPFVIAGQLPGFRHESFDWFKRLMRQGKARTQIHPSRGTTLRDYNGESCRTLPNVTLQ